MAHFLPYLLFGLLVILFLVWGIIIFSLVYRKVRSRQLQNFEKVFATQIALYLYPAPGETYSFLEVNRALLKAGAVPSKKGNIQFLIDLMIRTQKSMLGENYKKLRLLFSQIPPYHASASKLRNRKWYIKARGIREIYEMEQKQYLKEILKERNHPNIYVRREAQIAMVIFLGWESLRFLPYLKREMTLWQQIKIVEKLYDLHPTPEVKYLRKAYNTTRPYAQELLMRIIRKFELFSEVGFIIKFLDHENFDRRETAIYCINSFVLGEEQVEEIKKKVLQVPNIEQQVQLLKYIERSSDFADISFYTEILKSGHEILKLSVAEILWNSGNEYLVHEFYYSQYPAAQKIEEVV